MKYLTQTAIILAVSFLAELCHSLIPAPIPASVYGMILMFLALMTGIIKLDQVKETGNFLVGIMGAMFIVPTVGLLDCWDVLRENLISTILIIAVSLILSFAVAGFVTQYFVRRRKNHA